MKKQRFLKAAILALVIVGKPACAWAADFMLSTASDSNDVLTNKLFGFGNNSQSPSTPEFKGEWSDKHPINVSGYGLLGDMYYPRPDVSFSGNCLIATNDFDYDSTGLLLAGGFFEYYHKEDAKESVDVSKNTIIIQGAEEDYKNININGYVELVAGYVSKYAYGTANSNKIVLKDAVVNPKNSSINIYGTFANQKADIDLGKVVKAEKNEVLVSNTIIKVADDADRYIALFGAGVKSGFVRENEVYISNSLLEGGKLELVAGRVEVIGNSVQNKLLIYGTDLENSYICAGDTTKGTAKDNIANISNADLKGSSLYGGYSQEGIVEGNIINIFNTNIENSYVCAGYTADGTAKDNIVNISNANLKGSSLYGGYSANGGIVSGNTLNIGKNITGKLNTIDGFNTINFENINWENGGTVIEAATLKLTGNSEAKTGSLEDKGTEVIIKKISGDVKVNDYMNLITSDEEIAGKLANAGEQSVEVSVSQVVKVATGKLEKETNAIKFSIVGAELNPQVRAIGEASAVANAFVANGTGLVEDSINAMMCEERIGYKTFAQVHGSNLDFDTANSLSVKGWSGIVGVGETTKDRLTYGIFFETGEGDYNTLAKRSEGYIRGDGEVDYNGGGLLVRKDYENGIYTEASLRAGRMSNELRDAVVDSSNKLRGFDVSSTYYGAHIGVGKIIPRGEKESLDIYGKFLYSHHDGDSFVIDGDTFNLDSVNSQRLRVGFRYNELNGSKLRMYYGAAYEYEFDGDANNTVLDYNFSSPDLGGSTVIGELGFHYNADAKWCFDVNLRGYGGKREGISGSVQANYSF